MCHRDWKDPPREATKRFTTRIIASADKRQGPRPRQRRFNSSSDFSHVLQVLPRLHACALPPCVLLFLAFRPSFPLPIAHHSLSHTSRSSAISDIADGQTLTSPPLTFTSLFVYCQISTNLHALQGCRPQYHYIWSFCAGAAGQINYHSSHGLALRFVHSHDKPGLNRQLPPAYRAMSTRSAVFESQLHSIR